MCCVDVHTCTIIQCKASWGTAQLVKSSSGKWQLMSRKTKISLIVNENKCGLSMLQYWLILSSTNIWNCLSRKYKVCTFVLLKTMLQLVYRIIIYKGHYQKKLPAFILTIDNSSMLFFNKCQEDPYRYRFSIVNIYSCSLVL